MEKRSEHNANRTYHREHEERNKSSSLCEAQGCGEKAAEY
jgi:hypothetical protein